MKDPCVQRCRARKSPETFVHVTRSNHLFQLPLSQVVKMAESCLIGNHTIQPFHHIRPRVTSADLYLCGRCQSAFHIHARTNATPASIAPVPSTAIARIPSLLPVGVATTALVLPRVEADSLPGPPVLCAEATELNGALEAVP